MHYSANAGATARRLFLVSILSALALLGFTFGANQANAAPTISIVAGPAEGSFIQGQNVVFSMQATVPAANPIDFVCSIDNPAPDYPCHDIDFPACAPQGPTKSCTQSITYPLLPEGSHVFRTSAIDCDDPCNLFDDGVFGPIAARSFTVDRTPAVVALAGGPSLSAPVTRGKPTFSFIANEPVTYTCAKDGAAPVPCVSPVTLNGVSNGKHSLSVSGTDRAGNVSAPLVLTYAVDIFKPKRCKKGKSKKAKAKAKKCKKANAKAKARWRARNR